MPDPGTAAAASLPGPPGRPNASSSHAGDACAAQEDFFSSFEHSFTAVEWEAIRSPDLSVDERYREFYLHWALKEAYIKGDDDVKRKIEASLTKANASNNARAVM